MNCGNSVQARATFLRHAATQRWLVKDEIYFLLRHSKLVGVPMRHSLLMRPPSGTLLFYNTQLDYKQDGWRWQKRKDKGERVREDRAKLVINREIVILGTYVHSAETSTFHRRIYSLRNSKENVILVHYFDEINKVSVARQPSLQWNLNPYSKFIPRGRSHSSNSTTTIMRPSELSLSEGKADSNYFNENFEPRTASYNTCSQDVDDVDQMVPTHVAMEGLTTRLQADDLFHDVFTLSTPDKATDSLGGQQTFEQIEISDFSPDWDFKDGGAKILICLAASIPEIATREPAAMCVQFGNCRVHAERISETVLRCTAPGSTNDSVDMFVCHWDKSQRYVQLSHKKRFTYRNRYPVSPLFTGCGANKSKEEESDTFGYTASSSAHVGKRVRSPTGLCQSVALKRSEKNCTGTNTNLSTFVESDYERQCKIQVVERLSEFHQAIRTKTAHFADETSLPHVATDFTDEKDESGQIEDELSVPSSSLTSLSTKQASHYACLQHGAPSISSAETVASSSSLSEPPTALDDCTIEALSDNDLEQLSEKLLERVVRQLVTVAHTSEELLEELNSLDETGLSLLHYVSFYNYSRLVPLLIAHGAHIDQQSTQGQTALHLAAGCGHDDVVDVLLRSGANLQSRDFDGLTAADRAEKSGHIDVATKLHHHMGYETSSNHWGPVKHSHSSNDSPMNIDDTLTPYYDAGDMGLLAEIDDLSAACPSHPYVKNHCERPCDSPSLKATSYVGENQEHNRKLLLGAFSTMSLHDKCALSLTISRDSGSHVARRRDNSIGDERSLSPNSSSTPAKSRSMPASMIDPDASFAGQRSVLSGYENDSDVQCMIADDEESLNKLRAAMELMGPEERQSLEDEVKILQHGIRAWLLKRNCKNMRETTKQLREATQSIEDQQKQQEAAELEAYIKNELSERERAAVTVQAATRTMLARRTFLQTKHVAIKFQAATRGILCRKNFARMKAHALASLVIQRNVREWWNKQPAAIQPKNIENEGNDKVQDSESLSS